MKTFRQRLICKRHGKVIYRTFEEAAETMRRLVDSGDLRKFGHPYTCKAGNGYHITTKEPAEYDRHLAEVLTRTAEAVPVPEVGKWLPAPAAGPCPVCGDLMSVEAEAVAERTRGNPERVTWRLRLGHGDHFVETVQVILIAG